MRRNGVSSWGRIERPAGAVDGGESLGFPPADQAREGSAIRSEDLRISSPVSRLSVARFEGFLRFIFGALNKRPRRVGISKAGCE